MKMTEIYKCITDKKKILAGMNEAMPHTTRGEAVYVSYNDGSEAWVESHCCRAIEQNDKFDCPNCGKEVDEDHCNKANADGYIMCDECLREEQ